MNERQERMQDRKERKKKTSGREGGGGLARQVLDGIVGVVVTSGLHALSDLSDDGLCGLELLDEGEQQGLVGLRVPSALGRHDGSEMKWIGLDLCNGEGGC